MNLLRKVPVSVYFLISVFSFLSNFHQVVCEIFGDTPSENNNEALNEDDELISKLLNTPVAQEKSESQASRILKLLAATTATPEPMPSIPPEFFEIDRRNDDHTQDLLRNSLVLTVARCVRDIIRQIFYQTTLGRTVATVTVPMRALRSARRNIRDLYRNLNKGRRAVGPAIMRKNRLKRYVLRRKLQVAMFLFKLLRRIQIRKVVATLLSLRKSLEALLEPMPATVETITVHGHGWGWNENHHDPTGYSEPNPQQTWGWPRSTDSPPAQELSYSPSYYAPQTESPAYGAKS